MMQLLSFITFSIILTGKEINFYSISNKNNKFLQAFSAFHVGGINPMKGKKINLCFSSFLLDGQGKRKETLKEQSFSAAKGESLK